MNRPVALVLGFEPFGGETVNPSQQVAERLDGEVVNEHHVIGVVLPVDFVDAPLRLADLLERHRPKLVIALGQAGGRGEISLERVAVNLIDARIADNAGLQPVDAKVFEDGPNAYFSSLPLKAMRARLAAEGIPAALSLSAGTFVCNQVFYWVGHLLATEHAGARGGFIHVPWLTEQAARHPGDPGMPLDTMVRGVRSALDCALRTPRDLHVAAGSTH